MATTFEPALPAAAGPLSAAVLDHLGCRPPRRYFVPLEAPVGDSDPYGLDLQLALYVCYELHYRGFAGVDPQLGMGPWRADAARQARARVLLGGPARRRRVRFDGRRRNGEALHRIRRRQRAVPLPSRPGQLAADAGVLRTSIAVPPQGRRPACVGDSPSDGHGQGRLRRGRVRRIRRRPRRSRSPAVVRRAHGRRGAGSVVPALPRTTSPPRRSRRST